MSKDKIVKDFLGNRISVGDEVLTNSRTNLEHTVVTKLSPTRVYFEELFQLWQKDYYFRKPEQVISLTALGVPYNFSYHQGYHCDACGNELHEGDYIVYNCENCLCFAKVYKFTAKRCYIGELYDENFPKSIARCWELLKIDEHYLPAKKKK